MKRLIFFIGFMLLVGFMQAQAPVTINRGGDEYLLWSNTAVDDATVTTGADTSIYLWFKRSMPWSLQVIATQGDGSSGDVKIQVSHDFTNWEDYSGNSTDTFDGTDTTFYYDDNYIAWKYMRIKCDTIDATVTVRLKTMD